VKDAEECEIEELKFTSNNAIYKEKIKNDDSNRA
jgi:hypothetical protein